VISTKTEEIPAKGHEWKLLNVLDINREDCTKTGSYTVEEKCEKCGNTREHTYEIAAKEAHNYGEPVKGETVAATCVAEGYTEYTKTCADCGHVDTYKDDITAIDPANHVASEIVTIEAVPATCTAGGTTAGTHCNACDKDVVVPEATEIDPTNHVDVTPVAGKAASCTETGLTDGEKCACGEITKAQEEIPALGHDYKVTPSTSATCTEAGKTTLVECTRCNYKAGGDVIPATGHDYKVTTAAVAATCTTAGNTEGKKCSKCDDEIKAETIDALGHTPVTDAAVAATCTVAGKTEGSHCSVCGTVIKAQETVPATGHTAGEAVQVLKKAPTYTETGSYESVVYCKDCKTKLSSEMISIAKLVKNTQKITAKTTSKTYKVSAVKKKAQSFSIAASATDKSSKITYSKTSGNKNITVSSKGKVTVKKGTKKGTYKIKVKVTAAATTAYKKATKTVTIKVVVK
jgi:hypothetical protein